MYIQHWLSQPYQLQLELEFMCLHISCKYEMFYLFTKPFLDFSICLGIFVVVSKCYHFISNKSNLITGWIVGWSGQHWLCFGTGLYRKLFKEPNKATRLYFTSLVLREYKTCMYKQQKSVLHVSYYSVMFMDHCILLCVSSSLPGYRG